MGKHFIFNDILSFFYSEKKSQDFYWDLEWANAKKKKKNAKRQNDMQELYIRSV